MIGLALSARGQCTNPRNCILNLSGAGAAAIVTHRSGLHPLCGTPSIHSTRADDADDESIDNRVADAVELLVSKADMVEE